MAYDCYFCSEEIPKIGLGRIVYCGETWHYGCFECARIAAMLGHPSDPVGEEE